MRLALIPLVAALACGGGKQPAPAQPEEPAPPAVDRAMLVEIAAGLEDVLATMAAIAEGAPDCPAMAAQLTSLFDKSAPLFELAKTQDADPEAGPLLRAELDGRAARVQPLVERIGEGLGRCQMDAGVAAAMEKMPTF